MVRAAAITTNFGAWNTMLRGCAAAIAIADDRRCLTCLRYIEQNPWRANMVSNPESYRWSSCRVHALGDEPEWLAYHPVYLALGTTDAERQIAYRAICGCALTEEELTLQRHPEQTA